jgi:Tfp pilus assembly protein PilO
MRAVRADRLWMIGGALGAVLLLAIGWFFLISPQRAQTSKLTDEAGTAQVQLTSLRHRLAELRQQNTRLPEYRAQLATDQQALPTTSGLSDFVRQLQLGGERTEVAISGVVVGALAQVPAGDQQVYALPLTLTATGSTAGLGDFLDQLQRVLPRAVLLDSTVAAPAEHAVTLAGPVTLTVGLQVFVASTGDAETAAPATKTN